MVVGVKSLTTGNEPRQIRGGPGQVLEYAHPLRSTGKAIRPVLFLEQGPEDGHWTGLRGARGVVLARPGRLAGLPGIQAP